MSVSEIFAKYLALYIKLIFTAENELEVNAVQLPQR